MLPVSMVSISAQPGAAAAAALPCDAEGDAAEGVLPVSVVSISGRVLELELRPQGTARELKARIADAWRVPALCQQLLLGAQVLDDDAPLQAHIPGKPTADGAAAADDRGCSRLTLQLVVSDCQVYGRLQSEDRAVRLDALRALVHSARRGNERAVQAVVEFLADMDAAADGDGIEAAALEVLGQVAAAGDADAIIAASARLQEHHVRHGWLVRRAAAATLGQLAEPGDGVARQVLRRALKDMDWRVRAVAAEAVAALAGGDAAADTRDAAALAILSEDKQWRVREAAIAALGRVLSPPQDTKWTSFLRSHLRDAYPKVAVATAVALGKLAARLDGDTVQELVRLEGAAGTDPEVRAAAAAALEAIRQR